MDKCFILLPIEEPTGYSQGHFNRVYDYVIVPACRAAGFWPHRADTTTYNNPLEVVKNMIDSEVVLCDLSANNSNALYGLAIRQSLDLPITLMKDMKSFIAFDANEFGVVEYDESLRIDNVQKAMEVLSQALKGAIENKKPRYPLLDRLSIGLPQYVPVEETSDSTPPEPVVEERPKEPSLPIISPLPDYVGEAFTAEQMEKIKTGDSLFHLHYGKGKVNFIKNAGKDKLASIQFEAGPKLLVLIASDFFRKINK
ncbi:MAG: hypothetical protein JST48_06665 [Bacteroidetes bacterium]|nr:hypothetical protein [Bacteroidota bacterium]